MAFGHLPYNPPVCFPKPLTPNLIANRTLFMFGERTIEFYGVKPADWSIGTGDFTVDCYCYSANSAGCKGIFGGGV